MRSFYEYTNLIGFGTKLQTQGISPGVAGPFKKQKNKKKSLDAWYVMASAEDKGKGKPKKHKMRKPRSTARIQLRGDARGVWHRWVQKWRKKTKKNLSKKTKDMITCLKKPSKRTRRRGKNSSSRSNVT